MSDEHSEDAAHEHVVSLRLLVAVWVGLLILTWLTVAAAGRPALEPVSVWVALLIAVAKASLVVLYFMHLRWDSLFNGLIFIISLFFVALFIAITLMDTAAYQSAVEVAGG